MKTKIETPEVKLAEISKEVVKVEKEAKSIVVKTQEDYESASKFLSGVLKPRVNRITELMNFFTKPYVEQRRVALAKKQEIEEMFGKQLNPLIEIENTVKKSMGTFLKEQEMIARKEEERLAKLREKQNERREDKGLAPIVAPLPTIERVQPTIKNEYGGKTTAKKVWKFEIVDSNKLPKEVIDQVLAIAIKEGITSSVIRKMVNAGMHEIQGCRIWEDFDISATGSK